MLELSHSQSWRIATWARRWAVLLACAVVFAASAQDKSYVVKRGDTLSAIARQHHLSVDQLAKRNGISPKARIYVGQRLMIPGASGSKPPPPPPVSSSVQKAIAAARVAPHRWKYIVIHHAGVDVGSLKSLDRYHREERRMENGLAYHFLIGNGNGMGDGEIAVGNRWHRQLDGGHLSSVAQNRVALGICLIGNFDKSPPTERQLRSLEALTRALMKRCQLGPEAVKTHQQINVVHTRCPGSKFPTSSFRGRLK